MAGVYGRGEATRVIPFFSLRGSNRRRAEREAADRLYAACVDAARQPDFFIAFGIPDTLQGRFEALALNLFPVLHRLMHAPGDAPDLARLVSESFVADMDAAFREMGVGDVAVPKRMVVLYRSFGGRLTAYRDALAEGPPALAAAVMRNVFPEGGRQAAHAADALSAYLAGAVAAIAAAPLDELRRGAPPFPPAAAPGAGVSQ